jgi:hypothetical protein
LFPVLILLMVVCLFFPFVFCFQSIDPSSAARSEPVASRCHRIVTSWRANARRTRSCLSELWCH